MKKLLFGSLLSLLSCGGGTDKLAKLESLRAQYNALSTEINALEQELKDAGLIKLESKSVEVTSFSLSPFNRVVTIQGVVDGDEIISVNPTASGRVVELNVKVGQVVKQGDIMARIDDEILRKTMKELKTALDLATTLYNKQASLWSDSIGSEVQYIQSKNTKESLEAKIGSLKEQMELYLLRAPIDGSIDVVNLRQGQMASPQMVGIVVVDFDQLKVKGQVSEAYSAVVKDGQTIDIEFPDLQKTIPLKISAVSNFIDPKNRSFTIEAALPRLSEVKANMLAKMCLVTYTNAAVISVPINIIESGNNTSYVWTVVNGKAHKQEVILGQQSDNSVEVLEGLSSRDAVVTVGYQGLTEGEALNISNS